jgi:spermidine/putrescine transport system ATP-binding protein
MGTVLELTSLSKHYPAHRALDRLSLSIGEGEFFSLLGPSGCGKTTTLRLVAGFEEPSDGDIRLRGARINSLRPYERNVSTVFQSYALFPHLTVQGNIEFGLKRRNANGRDAARRVRDAIEMLQLSGKEERLPAQLSGGERQRVALARSLVVRPDVLLLDEPLSALDPNLRKQLRNELKSLQRRVGITFLFVTHDQEEALSLSDRIAVLNAGKLEQVGAPQDIYSRPQSRFTASFIGSVNWIQGIGVRPEATRITDRKPDGCRSVEATVESCIFLGNCLHVETRLASGEAAIAEVSCGNGIYQRGQPVYLWWERRDELALPPQ